MYAPTIIAWMQRLKRLLDEHQYIPSLIFNIDETMLHPGKQQLKVLVRAHSKKPIEQTMTKTKHISFGLCVAADGTYVKPLVIFSLKTLPKLSALAINFFAISGQENGWMTKEGYKEWLVQVFIPHVEEIRANLGNFNLRALLLIDGHNSRDQLLCSGLCAQFNIDVFCFVAHSSATCQPLDLGVNGVFKSLLAKELVLDPNETSNELRCRLLSLSVLCLVSVMTPLHILKGFSRTGIYPFSEGAPLKSELVRDPVALAAPPPPPQKKRGPGISGRILTNGIPNQPVYLSYAPPPQLQLPPVPQHGDYLMYPADLNLIQ